MKIDWKLIVVAVFSLALIIIAGSISMYYLYILPSQQAEKLSFEKQKYEDEQTKQALEQKAKDDREAQALKDEEDLEMQLDFCLIDAQLKYEADWATYCGIWKSEVKDTYEDCKITWQNLGYTLQQAKDHCWTSTPDYNETPDQTSCYLPTKYSDKVNGNLDDYKSDCYMKYSKN